MARFEFYGQLKAVKETEDFKALEIKTFQSGWTRKTLKVNAFGNGSRYSLQSECGYWGDGHGNCLEKNTIFSKDINNNNITIPYGKRFNVDVVNNVHYSRSFDIVLLGGEKLNFVKNVVKQYEEGKEPSENTRRELNIDSYEDAVKLLKQVQGKHYKYVFEGDFQDKLQELLKAGEFDNVPVKVTGEYSIQYGEQSGQFYKKFKINKIYCGEHQHQEGLYILSDVIFDKNPIEKIDGSDDVLVNTFIRYYDSNYKSMANKGYVMCPFVIKLQAKDRAFPALVKRFSKPSADSVSKYRQLGLEILYVNGAEANDITLDDLTEEEREDINFGLRSFEDIKKTYGGKVYGDRITEFRVYKTTSSVEDTAFEDKDFELPTHDVPQQVKVTVNATITTDDDDDLPFDI